MNPFHKKPHVAGAGADRPRGNGYGYLSENNPGQVDWLKVEERIGDVLNRRRELRSMGGLEEARGRIESSSAPRDRKNDLLAKLRRAWMPVEKSALRAMLAGLGMGLAE